MALAQPKKLNLRGKKKNLIMPNSNENEVNDE